MPVYEVQLVTIATGAWRTEAYGYNSVPVPRTGDHYDLSNASLSIIRINDQGPAGGAGDVFNVGYGAEGTQQTLAEDTLLGNDATQYLYPAGTTIAVSYTRILATATPVDADGNPQLDQDGNPIQLQYTLSLPMDGNDIYESLGGKQSFMILPLGHDTPFDLTMTLRYDGLADAMSAPYPPQPIYPDAPCFTSGTLIDTPHGPVPIQDLRPGDLVLTRDNGPQPIRWVGGRLLDARALDLRPNLRPIRIRAGALGPGQPCRDLVVSPQHRILVQSSIAARMFDSPEVLIAAKHLCLLDGITPEAPPDGVHYLHILLDRHEVLRSNGAWTESLLTGPQALKSLTAPARHEILSIFPELAAAITPPGARPLIEGRRSRKLAERHQRNRKALVA
ncbi:Hint domain-containing protein [Paracoccus jiaweipingae]|uniref:Hint domain-containing protein n=1 Tax=unclassified Paracoccus (in: a-proteobacteria) TaxID=2688777 RepID=UPI003789E7DF